MMLCIAGTIFGPVKWSNRLYNQAPYCDLRQYDCDEIEMRTDDIRWVEQQVGWTALGNPVFTYDGHNIEFCGPLNGQI